jgi:uncharacterized lipoprotein YddW (UPF0748 family)
MMTLLIMTAPGLGLIRGGAVRRFGALTLTPRSPRCASVSGVSVSRPARPLLLLLSALLACTGSVPAGAQASPTSTTIPALPLPTPAPTPAPNNPDPNSTDGGLDGSEPGSGSADVTITDNASTTNAAPANTAPLPTALPVNNPLSPNQANPPFIGPLLPPLTPPEPLPPVIPPLLPNPPVAPPITPLPPTTPVIPAPQELGQVRGLWVDAFGPGLKTPVQVAQMIRDARSLGVNTLFVQTIRRADCLCNRSSVPRATDDDLTPGFDPLAEVIRLAHAQKLRVFAWVSVTGAGSAAVPNTNRAHVLYTHGANAGAQSWLNRHPDGTYLDGHDIWLDAGIPQAAEFMAQEVLSIVKNYDIDGIQLDRIRYPDGGSWGYSPVTLARYRSETGKTGMPGPNDASWTAWKREQITALVRRIALEARRIKPTLWTSAATITYGAPPADLVGFTQSRTYNDVLQDWPAWSREGLLDLNVLMNYKQDALPGHISWFDDWNAFALRVRGKSDVAAGTALYLNTPDVSRRQMQRALQAGLGWVGYAYRTPGVAVYKSGQPQPQGFERLKKSLTENGGPLTPTVWNATPPERYAVLGRIKGSAQPGGRPVSAVSPNGILLGKTVTDGNGYYGFSDLPLGSVEVRVAGQRWQGTLARPGVTHFPDLLVRDVNSAPAAKGR